MNLLTCDLCEKADRPIGECPAGSTIEGDYGFSPVKPICHESW